jgi:predicted dehydrogenase
MIYSLRQKAFSADWMENAAHIVHSHTYAPYPYTVQALDKFFVEEVMAKGAAPLSTLSDAILAQKICEAAEESCETGRHVAL